MSIIFRPYYARRIPHSNLLFVVVMANTASCDQKLSAAKQEIVYNITQPPCHKLELNNLPRRKLSGCYTEDPMVIKSKIVFLLKK